MTDNQDSVTAGAVQPPTDRPLTAGDENSSAPAMLRQLAKLQREQAGWANRLGQPGCSARLNAADNADALAWAVKRLSNHNANLGNMVIPRPATSAASDGEGVDRVMAVLNHWFDGRARIDRNSEMVAQLAALASPPVSERERELEGALRLAKERIQSWPIDDHETCMCGSLVEGHDIGSGHSPVSQADHAISTIVQEIDQALAALNEQPQ